MDDFLRTIWSIIIKALGECQNIQQETVSQVKHLIALLLKIQEELLEKAPKAVDWLICYVKSIAIGIFSFDVFGATTYLPKDITEKLQVLGEDVKKIVDTDGTDIDEIIDALETANVTAEGIFRELMNAVDHAKEENKWQSIAFCGGTTLVGGVAGAAYGAGAAAATAPAPYTVAGLVSMFQSTTIGGALFGGGSTATTCSVAATAGGLAVGAAAGLASAAAVAVPYYFLKKNRLQAEAKARIITLNTEIEKMKIKARKLLGSCSGCPVCGKRGRGRPSKRVGLGYAPLGSHKTSGRRHGARCLGPDSDQKAKINQLIAELEKLQTKMDDENV